MIFIDSFKISDGKFVPEGLVEMTKLATENDEKMVKIGEEIAEECKTVEDADRLVSRFFIQELNLKYSLLLRV